MLLAKVNSAIDCKYSGKCLGYLRLELLTLEERLVREVELLSRVRREKRDGPPNDDDDVE